MNSRTIAIAAALALSPLSLRAAAPAVDRNRPEAVVAAGAECSRRQDWRCLAGLMDPTALRDVRELMSATGGAGMLGVDAAQLQAMSDADTFAAFMGAVMQRAGGMRIESVQVLGGVPEGADQYHAITRTTVRLNSADAVFSGIEATSLNKVGGQWRMQLNGDAKKLLQMFKRLGRRPAAAGTASSGPAVVGQEPLKRPRLNEVRERLAREAAASEAERSAPKPPPQD
jgi:hypothetical protein